MRITSLDFETANYSRLSICAAGLAVFEEGELVESPYWLVRPPKGHGSFRDNFTAIHGLTWSDVEDAPEFCGIAEDLVERLTRADLVVAHNASFDIGHLRETLDYFGMPQPTFDYVCTCQLARRVWPELPNHRLSTLTKHIGHKLNHHQAQSDAEAAGRVLLAMIKEANANTPQECLNKAGMESKRFFSQVGE